MSDTTIPPKLNLGCNTDVRPDWVNVDIIDYGGNEIIDLNNFPWPWPDNSFDEITASHVLEHLGNFNAVVNELWRISKPGGRIEVRVPFFLSTKYYSEPDHRIPFGIRSFDSYEELEGRKLKFYEQWKLKGRTNYESPARFHVHKRFHFSNFRVLSWLDRLINLEPVMFERFLATILTPEEVVFNLEAVKSSADTGVLAGEHYPNT